MLNCKVLFIKEYAARAQRAMSLYKESLNSLTDFERDQMKEEKAQQKLDKLKRRRKKVCVQFKVLMQNCFCFFRA